MSIQSYMKLVSIVNHRRTEEGVATRRLSNGSIMPRAVSSVAAVLMLGREQISENLQFLHTRCSLSPAAHGTCSELSHALSIIYKTTSPTSLSRAEVEIWVEFML